jgi:protoporphyrinogen oxidase
MTINQNFSHLITGSSISSLFAAEILIQNGCDPRTIIVLEPSGKYGGLFSYLDDKYLGNLDIGMHTIQLTKDAEVNNIIHFYCDEKDFNRFSGNRRDLSGTIVNNQISHNGPYFDLDLLRKEDLIDLKSKLFKHLLSDEVLSCDFSISELENYYFNRFGKEVSKATYVKVLENRYKTDISKLDIMASRFTPTDRISVSGLFDDRELFNSEKLRKLIAWSDQKTLPPEFSSGLDTYYPKKFGVHQLVKKIMNNLESKGVSFIKNSKIENFEQKNNEIKSVTLNLQSSQKLNLEVKHVIISGGKEQVLNKLNIKHPEIFQPLQTSIMYLELKNPVKHMKDVFYFFSYLNKYGLYRVNNYPAYVQEFQEKNKYIYSFEFITLKSDKITIEKFRHILNIFNFVHDKKEVLYMNLFHLPGGFPYPSKVNYSSSKKIDEIFSELSIANLHFIGSSMANRLFFQGEILIDTKDTVNELH